MSEQVLTQSNEVYLAQHPDAIVDPHKAEFVGYAGKEQEVAVAAFGGMALRHAMNSVMSDTELVGKTLGTTEEFRQGNAESAIENVSLAEQARTNADVLEAVAAQKYDETQPIRDRIRDLTRGKS